MVTLVLGGSGSGKSAIAESMLEEIKDVEVKYYLATMQVYDEDAQRKVNRHRELRRGKDSAQSSSQEISSRLWTRWIHLVSEKARYCWNVCQIWRQMRCSVKTYARRTRLSEYRAGDPYFAKSCPASYHCIEQCI